jgi:hypothetical protein
MTDGILETFLKTLFSDHQYTAEKIVLYILAGTLAGLVRLCIRSDEKIKIKAWWDDGSLLGALVISIAGALLFDNSFIWAFLGGYFLTYVLNFIQKALDKAKEKINKEKEVKKT